MTSTYVAYLRDSGGEDQDLSVEQQETAIRAWCAKNGCQLNRIFRDVSAPGSSIAGRDQFLEMIHYFRSGSATETGIIVWKYSRFSRDINDAQFYKADLRRLGYEILSINDNVPEGLNGRLFEAAIDWMNARFLEDLSSDVKRGLRHIVENHAAMPGIPPKGFKREPVEIGSRRDGRPHIVHRWVPDPELWDRCLLAWEMRAAGDSYGKIHKKTRLFKTINSYTTFFRNKIYLGILEYGDLSIEDYTSPLITHEVWDQVQRINQRYSKKQRMSGDNPNHPRRENSPYLLSGLLYCSHCGSPMNGLGVYSGNKKPGQVARWYYYRCSNKQNQRSDCPASKIPQGILEESIIEQIVQFILSEENLQNVLAAMDHDHQKFLKEMEPKRQSLSKELGTIKQKLANITMAIADLGHSRALLSKLTDLEAQEMQIRSELVEIEMIAREKPARIDSEQLKNINQALSQQILAENQTQKREILQNLVERIEVRREGKRIVGKIWYYYPGKKKLMSKVSTSLGAPLHRHNFCLPFIIPIQKKSG